MILYKRNNRVYYEDINDNSKLKGVPDAQIEYEDELSSGEITISIFRFQNREHKNFFREKFIYSEVLNADEVAYGSTFKDVTNGIDTGQDVTLQDTTAPLIIASFSDEQANTTMSVDGSINDYAITITSATNFAIGQYLSIFNVNANRFYLGNILDISGNILTLDTRLDFAYPSGSFVTGGTKNMNVNGSVTPVIYGVRNTEEQIGSSFDITRIIIHCQTSASVDLSKFGDIAGGITRGISMRKVDGVYRNIFNAKTNGELKNLMFDFDIEVAVGNQQDGFTGRMTFAGTSKMGTVIRLNAGEDLQMIIQDNLSTLQRFEVICEGHIVDP